MLLFSRINSVTNSSFHLSKGLRACTYAVGFNHLLWSSSEASRDFAASTLWSYDLWRRTQAKEQHYQNCQSEQIHLFLTVNFSPVSHILLTSLKVLTGFPINKRIVLTGTPIQNDLQEFYALVEFCNPGTLGIKFFAYAQWTSSLDI